MGGTASVLGACSQRSAGGMLDLEPFVLPSEEEQAVVEQGGVLSVLEFRASFGLV